MKVERKKNTPTATDDAKGKAKAEAAEEPKAAETAQCAHEGCTCNGEIVGENGFCCDACSKGEVDEEGNCVCGHEQCTGDVEASTGDEEKPDDDEKKPEASADLGADGKPLSEVEILRRQLAAVNEKLFAANATQFADANKIKLGGGDGPKLFAALHAAAAAGKTITTAQLESFVAALPGVGATKRIESKPVTAAEIVADGSVADRIHTQAVANLKKRGITTASKNWGKEYEKERLALGAQMTN